MDIEVLELRGCRQQDVGVVGGSNIIGTTLKLILYQTIQ